jgi:hypothetical protein
MSNIDYRRHFALLLLAFIVLDLLVPPAIERLPAGDARFHAYFGLVGLLNSAAWVLALRVPASIRRRLAFILVAVGLSTLTPQIGMALAPFLPSNNDVRFFSVWAAASAFGAATYWLVIRGFWLRSLTLSAMLVAVVACVLATLTSLWTGAMVTGFGSRPDALQLDLPTAVWWLAFSTSTLWRPSALANPPVAADPPPKAAVGG